MLKEAERTKLVSDSRWTTGEVRVHLYPCPPRFSYSVSLPRQRNTRTGCQVGAALLPLAHRPQEHTSSKRPLESGRDTCGKPCCPLPLPAGYSWPSALPGTPKQGLSDQVLGTYPRPINTPGVIHRCRGPCSAQSPRLSLTQAALLQHASQVSAQGRNILQNLVIPNVWIWGTRHSMRTGCTHETAENCWGRKHTEFRLGFLSEL